MARSRDRSPRFFPLIDDQSGAIYSYVPSEQVFNSLPFKSIKNIGNGANGMVLLMRSKLNPTLLFAFKCFYFNNKDQRRNESRKRTFMTETAALQSVDHANIVKLYRAIMGPTRGVLLLNYCPEGSLCVDQLTDEQVKKYFLDILDAVQHIHSKRIVHRDIKLDNVLVKDDHNSVILTDFGLSEKLSEENDLVSGGVGTVGYIAPEVYRAIASSVLDGFKADAYSMGVYLWCLMQRSKPPLDGNMFKLWTVLETSENFDGLDPTLKDCVRNFLTEDPGQRAEVSSLHERLKQSEYIGKTDFEQA